MSFLWNIYAQCYDALRVLLPYQELQEKTAAAILAEANKPARILDAGCGTGNLACSLRKFPGAHHFCIEGIDASPYMLTRAKLKSNALAHERYQLTDLNTPLPFPDDFFDCVVCLNALYALNNPRVTLQEFRRVLRFGGLLIIANPKENPRVRDAFKAHFARLFKNTSVFLTHVIPTVLHLPHFLAIILINTIIKRRGDNRKYHFLNEENLRARLREASFGIDILESVYGNTALFATASKIHTLAHSKVPNLTVGVARSRADVHAIFSLRYRTYCEEIGSLDATAFPDKEEKDEYDQYSVQIVAKDGEKVVGILRLIKDNPLGFLMEQVFKLPEFIEKRRKTAVEHSRGIIEKEYRDKSIYTPMLEAAYEWQSQRGYDICLGAPRVDKLHEILLKKGWRDCGTPTVYHNATVVPMWYYI